MAEIRRLHWGCGDVTPPGWINSDYAEGPGVEIVANVLDGLPLESESIDYITAQHVLQDPEIWQQEDALTELRRVLKPDGVLRLSLPDLDRAIDAYRRGDQDYFQVWNWDTISGNFITQILWHNYTRTLFTYEFAAELLTKSGFRDVRQVRYGETASRFSEITELDNRPDESFYVEATR